MFSNKNYNVANVFQSGWLKPFKIILLLLFVFSCNDINFEKRVEEITNKYSPNGDFSQLEITQFSFPISHNSFGTGLDRHGFIDQTNNGIHIIITEGASITNLVPFVNHTGQRVEGAKGAGFEVVDNARNFDFTGGIEFRVFDYSGNFRSYHVTVSNAEVGDKLDGTVYVSSSAKTYTKCTIGQEYQSEQNDCKGTGDESNKWGAVKLQFCSANDNSCGDGAVLNGNGVSQVWNACATLTKYGGSWSLPATNMDLYSILDCGTSGTGGGNMACSVSTISPTINDKLFPQTPDDIFWINAYSAQVDTVNFDTGEYFMETDQTNKHYVRCLR